MEIYLTCRISQDYTRFFDQNKLNASFPGYKVKLVKQIAQETFIKHPLVHNFRRPPEHNSSKRKIQTLNVTEAIIQMLNNCINVILDCRFASVPVLCFPKHAPNHFNFTMT